MKPLFIPLKAEYFDAFERGEKRTEYRRRGPRWNAQTCAVGRAVVLSRGYGSQRRLTGAITGFCYDTLPAKLPGWLECYGPEAGDAACITITLDQRPGRGHKTKAACPQFRKPRTSPERVRAMHADYAAGMSFTAVGARHGRHPEVVRNLFIRAGLAVRTDPRKWTARKADGSYQPKPPHTAAQIEALIRTAKRIEVPAALKREWRQWTLARRGEFIARLRAQLNQPGHLPPGPFSSNVEPFDYASESAHRVAALRNQGHDSKTAPVKLKVQSLGVIWGGWLWCWVNNTGYVRGPHTKGRGKPVLHREIWKLANNAAIPRGHVIRHADGNWNNLDPANLVLCSRNDLALENRNNARAQKSRARVAALLDQGTHQLLHAVEARRLNPKQQAP